MRFYDSHVVSFQVGYQFLGDVTELVFYFQGENVLKHLKYPSQGRVLNLLFELIRNCLSSLF